MKRLIIIICGLLFISSTWANRGVGVIELFKAKERNRQKRSIPIIPSAYYDAGTIILYSSILLENLQVTIINEVGQVISEDIILVSPQHPYEYSIENIEDGTYVLELSDGEEEYYGSFDISQ